ncbi:MAG: NADH-quinone oxidoreductase subunit N [Chloroflexota bacterium]
MTLADLASLAPLLVLGIGSVVLMLTIAVRREYRLIAWLAALTFAAALASLPFAAATAPRQVTDLLLIDGLALFYIGLLVALGLVGVGITYGYAQHRGGEREEAYILYLLATLGGAVMAASTHFASFFLGLEILSVSLYGLLSYMRWRLPSIEAGTKYLVLASVSSAFLLFGMALVYAEAGSMVFARVAAAAGATGPGSLVGPGLALMIVGFGFKLGVVPFHMWTPDVYEGGPAPATAFIATVSKGAAFVLLLRFFYQIGLDRQEGLTIAFGAIAALSMLAGNLLALLQTNVKRILAYSSIAHLGYALVAFLAGGTQGAAAATFYLVAYFATTLAAFGVVAALSDSSRVRDADSLADYRGLFWRRPALTVVLTLALLSLAGIPLTAGFLGKLYVVLAGAGASLWWLLVVLVLSSAIGLVYYLRVATILFRRPSGRELNPPLNQSTAVALGFLTLVIVVLGVYPGPLIALIQSVLAVV